MKKGLDFYDSDLHSDNPDDFLSDHEPPSDIVRERKLLKKIELFRIYREIWQIGKGLPKPAKYDEVKVRYQKVQDPDTEINADNEQQSQQKVIEKYLINLKEQKQIEINLGKSPYPDWFESIIESMKKGECCLAIIEVLKRDENGMKVLDKREFYMFELEDWTTVIDLRQDMTMFKKVIKKGDGSHRCEKQDEIIVNYRLSYDGQTVEERISDEPQRIEELLKQGMSEVVWRVLRSMKQEEIAECDIKEEAVVNLELEGWKQKHEALLPKKAEVKEEAKQEGESIIPQESANPQESINQQEPTQQQEPTNNFIDINEEDIKDKSDKQGKKWFLNVELKSLVRIDDVFGEGSAVKKEILRGNSTSKPEKMSRIFFELRIKVDEELIYESLEGEFPILKLQEVQNFEFLEDSQCWKFFLDELKISKLLKHTLRRMKKQELAVVTCRDPTLIQYGRDYEILSQKFNGVIPKIVDYTIKLYNFTDPKNTFSMTIDEKIEQAQRKKIVGVKLIQGGNFKKASNQFEVINGFFELGKFIGEDAVKVRPHKLSSLLNTSLCYLKEKKWQKLEATCDKILELEPSNAKAIYRKASGLQHASDYEKAISLINKHHQLHSANADPNQLLELQKLRVQLIKQQEDYIKREKKAFSKLFS